MAKTAKLWHNMDMTSRRSQSAFLAAAALIFAALLCSCQSAKRSRSKNLRLLFAGDIMAHTQNFSMKDYSLIWDDVRDMVQDADYSFANLEAPVDKSKPFESYPTFNMQPSYPAAALDAGFNLISLANNHSNDQGSQGIKATALWAAGIENGGKTATTTTKTDSKTTTRAQNAKQPQAQKAPRPVYFSGMTENGDYSVRQFYWKESKIVFIAVTELLNTWANYTEINYVPPTKKGRAAFVKKIAALKEELQPDLFIVSVHTSEEEYVLTVLPQAQDFYHKLLDAGADVLVSNHPHVVRPIEFVGEKDSKKIRKVIIYANGNTISGQRRLLNYDEPGEIWNYTGDGRLFELELAIDEKGFFALNYKSTFITAFTPQGERSPVIKRLDENFIKTLAEDGQKKDSKYYQARLDALRKIKDIWTWQ